MVIAFGLFSMPPGGINKQPDVDYHVWMDRQMNVVANHPMMADVAGLNWWTTVLADEETLRFVGKLYRHYAIEGKTSKRFIETKKLFYRDPAAARQLLGMIGDATAAYLLAQVKAGAQVIQIFDSWVGALSPADYAEFVAPHSARILAAVDAPTIHFGTGATEALDAEMARAGGDVIGIDWRLSFDAVPADRAVQGNLDPTLVFAPTEVMTARAAEIIEAGRAARGHIFNLGHGVIPSTDPDQLARLTEFVQSY